MVTGPRFGQANCMTTRILIVDDSAHFRDTARELLTSRGLEVCGSADSGASAVTRARAEEPDGVLLDINLGDTDGYGVAASLAAARPGITILLTSSDTDDVPPELLAECGASGFVPKTELATADLAAIFGQS
jgi:DNA-binding NarL/FixJ family response regulator